MRPNLPKNLNLAEYRVSNWNRLKEELVRWGDIFNGVEGRHLLTTDIVY